MRKQDVAAMRAKSDVELKAEVKRLQSTVLKEDNSHAIRQQRRSVAQLLTIINEKRTYQSVSQNE